jgi:exportin-1
MRLLQDVLETLTDSLHKSGFKLQSTLLFMLLQVIQSQNLNFKLSPEAEPNFQFVYRFLVQSLSQAFVNIPASKTEYHIKRMFAATNNYADFKVA